MSTETFTTTAQAQEVMPDQSASFVSITVNDRAATREAIIKKVRSRSATFVDRSSWGAVKGKPKMVMDWDYTMIALHHAGRSHSCASGVEQMRAVQIVALMHLIESLKSVFVIKHFGGHREYPGQASEGKICPGNIGMELVRNIRTETQLLPPPAPRELKRY